MHVIYFYKNKMFAKINSFRVIPLAEMEENQSFIHFTIISQIKNTFALNVSDSTIRL